MALQHLRSSTANKRPLPAGMSDGQLAINTNLASPGLFFKDSNGDLVKVGPVHVGTTAPNASPAAGGQTGNTLGEQWLDTSGTNPVFKVWDGSAWQSEAGEFVNASGDTMTGALVMDNQQQVRFRETTANGTNFIAIQAPASVGADRTLTLPDVTGTLVSTGDTGSVTSTMIADGTIVDDDVNASAAIAGTKVSPDFGAQNVTTTGTSTAASFIPTSSTVPTNGIYLPAANSVALSTNGTGRLFVDASGILTHDGAQASFKNGTGVINFALLGRNTDGRAELTFRNNTGASNNARFVGTSTYLAVETSGSERLRITSAGLVGIGTSSPSELLHVYKDQNAISAIKISNPNTGVSAASTLSLISGTKEVGISAYNAGSSFQIQGFNGIVTQYQDFDTHVWRNNAGTERARIDSSGRLLVGTSSDFKSIPFQVRGSAAIGYAANDAFSEGLFFTKTRGSSPATQTIVQSGDVLGVTIFQGSDGTAYRTAATIQAEVDGTPGTNDMPGRLVFSTTADGASSPTERMRIGSNGNVGLGDVNLSNVKLFVKGVDSGATNYTYYTTDVANVPVFFIRNDGAFNTGTASVSPYNYTTVSAANVVVDSAGWLYRSTSSGRFKTGIETLEDAYADNILNCRPVWYRSTANADNPSWGWWGFIAEEVAEVDPRLVFWKTKETKLRDDYVEEEGKAPSPADYVEVELDTPIAEGVQYDRFVPHLLNLIKRQQQAIETLEAKVAALESV